MKERKNYFIIAGLLVLLVVTFITNGEYVFAIDYNFLPTINSFIIMGLLIGLLIFYIFKKESKILNKSYIFILIVLTLFVSYEFVRVKNFNNEIQYSYHTNLK